MEHSFMQTLRTGNDFMRKNKHIFIGFCVFSFLSLAGYLVLKMLYAHMSGEVEAYTALIRAFIAGDVEETQLLWQSVAQIGSSFADKAYAFFVADTFGYIIMLCLVVYLLSALRKKELTIGQAFHAGWRIAFKAWAVIAGVQLVKFAWSYKGDLYAMLHLEPSMMLTVINTIAVVLFYLVAFFMLQVIADGETNFVAAIRASWNVMRKEWTSVVLLFLTLLMTALMLVIVGMLLGGLVTHFFEVHAWYRIGQVAAGVFVYVLLSYMFSVYNNKIYMNSK